MMETKEARNSSQQYIFNVQSHEGEFHSRYHCARKLHETRKSNDKPRSVEFH